MSSKTDGDILAYIFGENLKRLRKAFGYNQTFVAEKFGIEQSALSRIELGKIGFTPSHLATAADLFGCAPWELLRPISDPAELKRNFDKAAYEEAKGASHKGNADQHSYEAQIVDPIVSTIRSESEKTKRRIDEAFRAAIDKALRTVRQAEDNSKSITFAERALLEAFEKAPPHIQDAVRQLLEGVDVDGALAQLSQSLSKSLREKS